MSQHNNSDRAARAVKLTVAVVGLSVACVGWYLDLGEPGLGQGQAALIAMGVLFALSCFLPLEWNKKLLLLVGAVGLSLVVAEAALQLFFGARFRSVYQIDVHYLHKYIPNRTRQFQRLPINGGESIDVKINGQGFRGEELRNPPPAMRIVVYGDSSIAAEYSELEHTFVERLESRIASALGADVEAVNAGVVAYGPDQIAVRMEREITTLEPDLILVGLFAGNDFGDLLRNKIFKLDPQGQLRRNEFVLSESLKRRFTRAAEGPIVYKLLLKGWRLRKSPGRILENEGERAEQRMQQWLQRCRDEYHDYVIEKNNEVDNLLSDSYDADVSLTPASDSAIYKKNLMAQVLLRIQETADRHFSSLVFLLIPTALDVCDDYDLGEVDRNRYPEYKRSALTDVLETIAKRHGMDYLNLFEPFRERDANELYFHGGDVHWNDAGQEIAADLMQDYIIKEKLLPDTTATARMAQDSSVRGSQTGQSR